MDENVVSPSNNRALFIDESKELLAGIPTIQQAATFDKLTLYERTNTEYNQFMKLTGTLLSVGPYTWTDNDVAYRDVGDYVGGHEIVYPFRSLFTKRSVDEREFTIDEDEKTISILPLPFRGVFEDIPENKIQKPNEDKQQCIRDAYFDVDIDPVFHSDNKSNTIANTKETIPNTTLKVKVIIPCDESMDSTNGNITTDPIQPADKFVRNPEITRQVDMTAFTLINSTISEATASVNVIQKQESLVYDSMKTTDLNPQAVKECGLLKSGTATATTADNVLRFTSLNQRGCLNYGIPTLEHKYGYLVAVEYRHIEGRPLMLSIINETAKHTELETYLSTNTDWRTDYFILPPLAPDGLGYNPYISNDSIGRHRTVNDLKRIRIYTFPYNELVHLHTFKGSSFKGVYSNAGIQVEHPNPAYYKILLDNKQEAISNDTTLILSQSYDKGWLAYEISEKCKVKSVQCSFAQFFSFLFGARLTNHVLVNNWSNGWILESRKSKVESRKSDEVIIILFFWPQLLEFIGFLLLPILFITRQRWRP